MNKSSIAGFAGNLSRCPFQSGLTSPQFLSLAEPTLTFELLSGNSDACLAMMTCGSILCLVPDKFCWPR